MDLRWHKVALSVQKNAASLHVDCNSIETKPLEPRGRVPVTGHTLLFIRASNAAPVEVQCSVHYVPFTILFYLAYFKIHPRFVLTVWKYMESKGRNRKE